MFTGIVQEIGIVTKRQSSRGLLTLSIRGQKTRRRSTVGSSVAVNGVCTTVAAKRGGALQVTYMPETQRKTTVSRWQPGTRLNLEPSLRFGDEVGGHFVFGHVDAVGTVVAVTRHSGDVRLSIALPGALLPLMVARGSVCVDGVSLTVVERTRDGFLVALIPHTLAATTLSGLVVGSRVNVEADMLARYVSNFSRLTKNGIRN